MHQIQRCNIRRYDIPPNGMMMTAAHMYVSAMFVLIIGRKCHFDGHVVQLLVQFSTYYCSEVNVIIFGNKRHIKNKSKHFIPILYE